MLGHAWALFLLGVCCVVGTQTSQTKEESPIAKHVVIIGGGIAGLSAAHVLSREKGLKITLLERHPSSGGHSRSESYVDIDGFKMYSDAGWRVFTDSYDDLFPLLAEVPYNVDNNSNVPYNVDNNDSNHSSKKSNNNNVRSNLVTMAAASFVNTSHEEFLYELRFGHSFSFDRIKNLTKFLSDFTLSELVHVSSTIALTLFGCDERLDSYENLTFSEYAYSTSPSSSFPNRSANTHNSAKKNSREKMSSLFQGVVDGLLPVIFGQMPHVTSANSSFHFINRVVGTFHNSNGATYYFSGPPNETMFGPWTSFLEKRDVNVHLNTVVESLIYGDEDAMNESSDGIRIDSGSISSSSGNGDNGKVTQILAKNKRTGEKFLIKDVDHVIIATHPRDSGSLLEDSNLINLAQRSETHFSGLTLFFSKYVITETSAYWYIGTPWHVATLTYEGLWNPTFFQLGAEVEIKQIINVVLCNFDTPGILTNKTIPQCTQEEMIKEVLAQMNIPDAEQYLVKYTSSLLDPRNETTNSKMAGVGDWTFGHSPFAAHSIPALNHFHSRGVTLAGSWTQFHYTQEGAAESGKLAAKHVLDYFDMSPSQPLTISYDQKWEVSWIRDIDRVVFYFGLPLSVTYAIILVSFITLAYFVFKTSFQVLLSFTNKGKTSA